MARTLKEIFAGLTDEQKAELLGEMPAFVAGLTPEQRKALDITEPEPKPPKPTPKPKGFFESLDEWAGIKS
jgi:hypothetical protein